MSEEILVRKVEEGAVLVPIEALKAGEWYKHRNFGPAVRLVSLEVICGCVEIAVWREVWFADVGGFLCPATPTEFDIRGPAAPTALDIMGQP